MCEHILGIEPASEDEKPQPRTSQAEKWALHLTAAKQFYERGGHLRVPRKHIETIVVEADGGDQEQRPSPAGSLGRQPTLPGGIAHARTDRAAIHHRNALDVGRASHLAATPT